MKKWQWQNGRQNSGYDKFFVIGARWPIAFDLYILRFRTGANIPPHTDKVASGKHYRLNIVIKKRQHRAVSSCVSHRYLKMLGSSIFGQTSLSIRYPGLLQERGT